MRKPTFSIRFVGYLGYRKNKGITFICDTLFRRERMGVEPTAARSARPATSFEDWGIHRDTTTPTDKFTSI